MSEGSTSLLTVMAYVLDATFSLAEIFEELQVYKITDPPLKKKGVVNFSKIVAPKNSILSIQFGNYIRGLESIKTVPDGSYEITTRKGDVYYDEYANLCKYPKCKYKRPGKGKPFPHQITLIYSYEPGVNINMFIFRKCIKIAGFKVQEKCEKMIMRLWKHHLVNTTGILPSNQNISFIFESTMTNKKFITGQKYHLTKINTIFNKLKEYEGDKSIILSCTYEPTGDTGVTLKLKSDKPPDYNYIKWTWDGKKFTDSKCQTIINQKVDLDQKCTTITIYDEKYLMSFRYSTLIDSTSAYIQAVLRKYAKHINVEINPNIVKFLPTFV